MSHLPLETLFYPAEPKQGNAPPLLFVHGAYAGAWCWESHFLPFFATRGYDCHALSLRGHAGSAGHEGLFLTGVDDYVADLHQVVSKLPDTPILVTHSMGGYVALRYLREGGKCAGLALIAPVPPAGLAAATWHLLWNHPVLLAELNRVQYGNPVTADLTNLKRLLFSADIDDAALVSALRQFGKESERAIYEMSLPDFSATRWALSCPTLVVSGQDDVIIPPWLAEQTARQLGVQATLVPGVAHVAMLDVRWQRVANMVLNWLRGLA